MLKITSNYRVRELVSFDELTDSEKSDFDYVEMEDRDTPRFFRAYFSTFDSHEFEVINRGISVMVVAPEKGQRDILATWDAIQGQSAWNAIVVRVSAEFDGIVVGYATW